MSLYNQPLKPELSLLPCGKGSNMARQQLETLATSCYTSLRVILAQSLKLLQLLQLLLHLLSQMKLLGLGQATRPCLTFSHEVCLFPLGFFHFAVNFWRLRCRDVA